MISKLEAIRKHMESEEGKKKLSAYVQNLLKEREEIGYKTEEFHSKFLDETNIKDYMDSLEELQKDLMPNDQLEEYWSLFEVAKVHGKPIPDDFIREINDFAPEIYHYKGYLFAIMHGQGSEAWWAPWDQYKHILGPEQLSLNI